MDQEHIYQLLRHRYRNWVMAVLSVVLLLALGLPLWDEWHYAHDRKLELLQEIQLVTEKAQALPEMQRRLANKSSEISAHRGIAQDQIPEFREQIQQAIRKHSCRLITSAVGPARKQPWSPEMKPFESSVGVSKEKPKFEIGSSSVSFTVEGELRNLDQLIADLRSLNDFCVLSKLAIQQPTHGQELRMDFDLVFFEIAETAVK